MVVFINTIRKGGGLDWQLQHPEYVVCEVQAERLNVRQLAAKCNLHPGSDAIIGISMENKKLTYEILESCCDSFRQDVHQVLIEIRNER